MHTERVKRAENFKRKGSNLGQNTQRRFGTSDLHCIIKESRDTIGIIKVN